MSTRGSSQSDLSGSDAGGGVEDSSGPSGNAGGDSVVKEMLSLAGDDLKKMGPEKAASDKELSDGELPNEERSSEKSPEGEILEEATRLPVSSDRLAGLPLVTKARARRFAERQPLPYHVAEALFARKEIQTQSLEEAAEAASHALSKRLAQPKETDQVKLQASKEGGAEVLDRLEGRFDQSQGEPLVDFSRLGLQGVPLQEGLAEKHERLLTDRLYATARLRYDDGAFKVTGIDPVEPSSKGLLSSLQVARESFSAPGWAYFLARSVGLATPSSLLKHSPSGRPSRSKTGPSENTPSLRYRAFGPRPIGLALLRLVPLVQQGFCLLELGPRQTGKTFVYEELAPQAHVLSEGTATSAQLVVSQTTGEPGLLATEDLVCFDEITTSTGTAEIVSLLKGYLSSGAARRGKEEIHGQASVALVSNIDQLVREPLYGEGLKANDPEQTGGQLFEPLPAALGEDTAVMERVSAFLPGWEVPKLRPEIFAKGRALPAVVLARVLEELRDASYAAAVRHRIELRGNLTGRDQRAAWETIEGLTKLICP